MLLTYFSGLNMDYQIFIYKYVFLCLFVIDVIYVFAAHNKHSIPAIFEGLLSEIEKTDRKSHKSRYFMVLCH